MFVSQYGSWIQYCILPLNLNRIFCFCFDDTNGKFRRSAAMENFLASGDSKRGMWDRISGDTLLCDSVHKK